MIAILLSLLRINSTTTISFKKKTISCQLILKNISSNHLGKMESHCFIHMRTISPLSTTFTQKEDDFSSTSSSPTLSAESSRSNSYDDWMIKRSLSQDDEDVERKELLANSQIKTTSLEIGRMSTVRSEIAHV